jgi:hypothetical protein
MATMPEEERRSTTVRLPLHMLAWVKLEAFRERKSQQDVITAAVRDAMTRPPALVLMFSDMNDIATAAVLELVAALAESGAKAGHTTMHVSANMTEPAES